MKTDSTDSIRQLIKVIDSIAMVCHEANRAFCQTIDDHTQKEWKYSPDWQRKSAIKGVEFHLKSLFEGREPPPSASHESWMEEKRKTGWKYGPNKDEILKEHPCYLPYDRLPVEQRAKDYIFGSIVKAFYNCYDNVYDWEKVFKE